MINWSNGIFLISGSIWASMESYTHSIFQYDCFCNYRFNCQSSWKWFGISMERFHSLYDCQIQLYHVILLFLSTINRTISNLCAKYWNRFRQFCRCNVWTCRSPYNGPWVQRQTNSSWCNGIDKFGCIHYSIISAGNVRMWFTRDTEIRFEFRKRPSILFVHSKWKSQRWKQ